MLYAFAHAQQTMRNGLVGYAHSVKNLKCLRNSSDGGRSFAEGGGVEPVQHARGISGE